MTQESSERRFNAKPLTFISLKLDDVSDKRVNKDNRIP